MCDIHNDTLVEDMFYQPIWYWMLGKNYETTHMPKWSQIYKVLAIFCLKQFCQNLGTNFNITGIIFREYVLIHEHWSKMFIKCLVLGYFYECELCKNSCTVCFNVKGGQNHGYVHQRFCFIYQKCIIARLHDCLGHESSMR